MHPAPSRDPRAPGRTRTDRFAPLSRFRFMQSEDTMLATVGSWTLGLVVFTLARLLLRLHRRARQPCGRAAERGIPPSPPPTRPQGAIWRIPGQASAPGPERPPTPDRAGTTPPPVSLVGILFALTITLFYVPAEAAGVGDGGGSPLRRPHFRCASTSPATAKRPGTSKARRRDTRTYPARPHRASPGGVARPKAGGRGNRAGGRERSPPGRGRPPRRWDCPLRHERICGSASFGEWEGRHYLEVIADLDALPGDRVLGPRAGGRVLRRSLGARRRRSRRS